MEGDNPAPYAGSAEGEPSQTMIAGHLLARNAHGEIADWDFAAEIGHVALENVIIEKMAKLAKLYAAGPPENEFRALKDRLSGISKGVEAKDQGAALMPCGLAGEEARPRNPTRDQNVGRDAFGQCIERAQDGSHFSAGIRAMEESIRVSAGPPRYKDTDHQFASTWSSIVRSGFRPFAILIIAALLGVGARVIWQHGSHEAKDMAKTWSSSLGWPYVDAKKNTSPGPVKATVATPPEVVRLDPIRPASAARRDSSEQPGAKNELTSQKTSTPLHRVEQDNKPKKLSPPLDHSKGIPTPEARPATIEGWTVHEVSDGVAVLEGPNGIWRAKRGDAVPGVGRVESIVRWGNYWVVATSNGLISTP
jgi:hypothetical protein